MRRPQERMQKQVCKAETSEIGRQVAGRGGTAEMTEGIEDGNGMHDHACSAQMLQTKVRQKPIPVDF